MTYTHGAVHTLATTGVITIASPIGLSIALANIPARLGFRASNPRDYFELARCSLGNADGFAPDLVLEHATTLLYPLPDSLTQLGLTLSQGATATVTELVAVVAPSVPGQPWDRAATALSQSSDQLPVGPASATLWSFTVPAGKLLYVSAAEIALVRYSAATTVGSTTVQLVRNSIPILELWEYTNTAGFRDRAQLASDGLVMQPGEVLAATYAISDTGGQHNVEASMTGFTFNV